MTAPALTFVHLADLHLQPGTVAGEGLTACLRAAQDHPAQPELLIYGGDYLMDANGAPRAQTQAQWDLFHQIHRTECALPAVHCLGNHDLWGWDSAASGARLDDPLFGKNWPLEELQLKQAYYSFDYRGWHFTILDSTHPWGRPGEGLFQALLGEAQLRWFAADLAAVAPGVPVCVISHMPIHTSLRIQTPPPRPAADQWILPGAWIHMDSLVLQALFTRHPNVRLCLSGHLHQRDRVESAGVTYIGSGSVSGHLWRDDRPETMPRSFSLVTLHDDGTFRHEWIDAP